MEYTWIILSIIAVLAYITFRYYLRTEYRGTVDATTFIVTVLIVTTLWRLFVSKNRNKMYF
jgi:uncharacterized membrane protein